ncbi:nuclear transport factor 2 family protein [Duganella sp. FT50W]|uniref:Nuclear transport factor 2 family protein n=2 Tax=Duganella lactea TaxID=2692173 RepID=A0A6L8MPV3_9BURK|nr:nuclear transport factor 2 family protein [Duganella lactea]
MFFQSAQGATPKDNAALVTDYLHALFFDKDLNAVEQYWGTQMIQHNPTLPDGHAVLRQIIGKLGPDFKYEQGLTMNKGNFVMVHGRYTGWGPKPMVGVDIFRIENGKVVEHWDVLQEEVPADKSPNGHAMFPAK